MRGEDEKKGTGLVVASMARLVINQVNPMPISLLACNLVNCGCIIFYVYIDTYLMFYRGKKKKEEVKFIVIGSENLAIRHCAIN